MISRILSVAVGLATLGCITTERKSDKISGMYVREYSFKVINPENDAQIGTRTIRDTIFLQILDDGYQVSNHKWRLNDYDLEGWRDMRHSDDRPMTDFIATFDSKQNLLVSKSKEGVFLYLSGDALFRDADRKQPYKLSH